MSGRGKFRIEPFKHRVELDAQYAEKTWKILKDAIHEINHRNASGLSFEELYRNAYNMVLHRHGKALYDGLVATVSEHLGEIAAAVDAVQGDHFLTELERRWQDHGKSMQMIRDILMYMDRIYVQPHGLKPVHDLGLALWRDHVMRAPSIKARVQAAVLGAITRERNGEQINQGLVRAVSSMLMDLGEDVYVQDFEEPFVATTVEFYRSEAQTFLASSDCADYLRRSQARLDEEHTRVKEYLNARTEPRVVLRVEEELLSRQMRQVLGMSNSGVETMLRDDKHDQLSLVYTLFKRVEGGLAAVKDMMAEHVRAEGKTLVTDPEKGKDPMEYVEGLLRMKAKYDAAIAASFASDRNFVNALHHAFEHFVNINTRSPEYISLYVDDKLRRGLKGASEEEIESVLDRVMTLFRFLQEKDVFEKYYKQHLGKRLLGGRTTSDDAEKSFILKLKTECGYQFTSKIEGMFNDMRTSRDTMGAFRKYLEEQSKSGGDVAPMDASGGGGGVAGGAGGAGGAAAAAAGPSGSGRISGGGGVSGMLGGIDLSVQVLTTGSWPTPGNGSVPQCTLPPQLAAACERYKEFYLSSHNGRRLSWLTCMGTADLRATFGETKRELSVSTYQMCILLLFNDVDSMSYKDILAATHIPADDLKRSLQSLACVKGRNVLRKEPMSKEVNDDDVFVFNERSTSKLLKVKIGTVSAQRESEPEKRETRQRIEDDRKPQIEAAIVRIMKARRQLDHNGVVTEVTKQLTSRFVPNPTDIKKHLENLIEREFIERDRNDRKLYIYLA